MNYNDVTGTIGVGLILTAYFLNIYSLIPKDGLLYFILNIIGACLACYASILIQYIPFIVLEGIWAIASVFGLVNKIRKNILETE
jgi:hypothetical protein